MSNDFLAKDYDLPTKDNYMKFVQGENTFRILSPAIVGYEAWMDGDDGKRSVTRFKMDEKIDPKYTKKESAKHFWSMVVWNYAAKKVQVLHITQVSVQKVIKAYAQNEKWGSPYTYDLVVTKSGEGLDTEYSVIAEPKEELAADIKETYEAMDIDMQAIYASGDPFQASEEEEEKEEAPKKASKADEFKDMAKKK